MVMNWNKTIKAYHHHGVVTAFASTCGATIDSDFNTQHGKFHFNPFETFNRSCKNDCLHACQIHLTFLKRNRYICYHNLNFRL